jgi:hypothetical protein
MKIPVRALELTQIVGQPCEFQVILGGPNRAGPGGPGWDREDPLSPTPHGARPRDRGPPRHCSWGLSNRSTVVIGK